MKKVKRGISVLLTMCFLAITVFAGSFASDAAGSTGTWKQDSKGYYFLYSSGKYAKSEWLKYNGGWYYFDKSGYMQTGWQRIGGQWYFFSSTGKMVKGWKRLATKWYYFAKNGAMTTGWLRLNGKWYYFDANGVMVTGQKKIGGKVYFFDKDGSMREEVSSLSSAKVGDIVTFGTFEQDDNSKDGAEKIEWRVIAEEKGKLLLLSEYGLWTRKYNEKYEDTTWNNSTIRSWLNGSFYQSAFTAKEKSKIQTTTVKADDNPKYKTKGGKDTQDKVFILSVSEAEKYMDSKSRGCKATAYALKNGVTVVESTQSSGGNCFWWLRTPGQNLVRATRISASGDISFDGGAIREAGTAIRPAIWITP